MKLTFFIIYCFVISFLVIFGLYRSYILCLYFRCKNMKINPKSSFDELPPVTVQLPVYNEYYVVERLIDYVIALDYPKDKLEIQVLDDSDDNTVDLIREVVADRQSKGFDIKQIRRPNREGYKAGALKYGMEQAKGEFIAIFDADFLPTPDFLMRTIHYFTDPQIGLVQSRWGHLNKDYSMLTRVQALLLDDHFVFYHTARSRSGLFFNFNGTGGIWRKKAIEEAGNWQGDTLTEDLDLSYRAQLKGWKFCFVHDLITPAELPVEMLSFKSQQHRWAKGAIQNAKKLLPLIWKSSYPLRIKLDASFHLVINFAYFLTFILLIILYPLLRLQINFSMFHMQFFEWPVFLIVTCSFWVHFFILYRETKRSLNLKVLYDIFFISSIIMGLTLNNVKACIEAMVKKAGVFYRTPKFNVINKKDQWKQKKYFGEKSILPILEISFGLYFGLIAIWAFQNNYYFSIFFYLNFLFGFLYVGFLSLFQRKLKLA